jgi:hypothetical protein
MSADIYSPGTAPTIYDIDDLKALKLKSKKILL